MALTIIDLVGDGVTTTFPINFPLGYLSREDITCRVNNEVDGLGAPVYRNLTWVSDSLVTVGGTVPGVGQPVRFVRTVSKTTLQHDYANGAPIEEANLDESAKQSLMAVQEVLDGRFSGFGQDVSAGGYKLTDLHDAEDPQDAVTLSQLEDMTGNAPVYAANAAASAASALISKSAAESAQGNAAVSEANAAASAALALATVGGVKITTSDTTAAPLDSSITVTDLVKTIVNPGANEQLNLSVPKASQAEAEAGSLDTKFMTALRTKQALDAQRKGIIQTVVASYVANASLTTLIPLDDTIPQNTEGTEIINVAFTPTRADSKIRIKFIGDASADALAVIAAALFKDTGADALAACGMHIPAANYKSRLELFYEEVSGNTTLRNYKIRAGANTGAMRFNGSTTGRHYGGVSRTYLIIEEHVS